jgi:chorismate mutase
MQMPIRGIRGAITVKRNKAEDILEATRRLLQAIVEKNSLSDLNIKRDLVGVTFTATPDLNAVYPAAAAREMGWTSVPLLCMQEMNVVGSLGKCIRVLVLWNTLRTQAEIQHVYMEGAQTLRPDLIEEE